MQHRVNVDHEAKAIEVSGTGVGSTADTLALIAEHLAAFRDCPGYDFLFDASSLSLGSSPADVMKICGALFEEGVLSFRRFAIVVPAERADFARMLAALVQPFGVTANVFGDRQDALTWLSSSRK